MISKDTKQTTTDWGIEQQFKDQQPHNLFKIIKLFKPLPSSSCGGKMPWDGWGIFTEPGVDDWEQVEKQKTCRLGGMTGHGRHAKVGRICA